MYFTMLETVLIAGTLAAVGGIVLGYAVACWFGY